jgi:hypothetical protein
MYCATLPCEIIGPQQRKRLIELELSKKKKIHKQEMNKLISKQQREINEILVRGGVLDYIEEPVHEAMVTCVSHIASFLMNKEWKRLMISSKRLFRASKYLDPAWTGYGKITWVHNFSNVVGFDSHPHAKNITGSTTVNEVRSNLRDSRKFDERSKFGLRDHSNIYIIDGQFIETMEHQRTEFESVSNPMGLGNTICFSSEYIATGGADECIRIWLNRAPYHLDTVIPEVGIIHDVAITFDSMFLAVRTSKNMRTCNTVSVRQDGYSGRVMNEIILRSVLLHGPMVFSETTDEIVLTGSSHDKEESVGTISLIFWKYKCQSYSPVYGDDDQTTIVKFPRYPCLDKSKNGVSSIYVSASGTTMAIQYRSPEKIVVMKRSVGKNGIICLVPMVKFDKYHNTFDRKILFSPSRYDDVIVFATDKAVYVASIKCDSTDLPLPVAYQNQYNSHPLCILQDEKAMLVTNKNDRSALIMSIPRVYRDYTRKCRRLTTKNDRSALIMSIPRVYRRKCRRLDDSLDKSIEI